MKDDKLAVDGLVALPVTQQGDVNGGAGWRGPLPLPRRPFPFPPRPPILRVKDFFDLGGNWPGQL